MSDSGDNLPYLVARAMAVNAIWWCRPVRDAVNRWVRPYQGQMSASQLADYIEAQLRDCFGRAGIDPATLAGQSFLEIGPGGNFGLAAVLLGFGVERVVCLDRDRLCFDSGIPEDLFQELDRRFDGRLASVAERVGDRRRLPSERFAYCVDVPVEEAPFADGAFDFVFSCACLEHVERPDVALRQLHRILRPGGRMLHQIDFRDHRNFARPLEFLRYSEPMWRFLSKGSSLNRWRASRYRAALAAAGFVTTFELATGDDLSGARVKTDYLAEIRPHLHRDFAALPEDDLTSLGMLLVAEKPGVRRAAPP